MSTQTVLALYLAVVVAVAVVVVMVVVVVVVTAADLVVVVVVVVVAVAVVLMFCILILAQALSQIDEDTARRVSSFLVPQSAAIELAVSLVNDASFLHGGPFVQPLCVAVALQ